MRATERTKGRYRIFAAVRMSYPEGYLISIGGAEQKGNAAEEPDEDDVRGFKYDILKNVVKLVPSENPTVEVITTASSITDNYFERYKPVFEKSGCGHVGHCTFAIAKKHLIRRSSSGWNNAMASYLRVATSCGFGFLNEVIIDTHFDKRGRFGRLAQAIASQPGAVGIGLGEDNRCNPLRKESTLKPSDPVV